MSNGGTGGKGGGTSAPPAGGNVYDQSANAFSGAGNAFNSAVNMFGQPGLTGQASTYNPSTMSAASYNPANMAASQAAIANMTPANAATAMMTPAQQAAASLVNPAQTANPAAISAGINNYMNPYTQNVIDRSIMNVNRMTGMQQDQNAAGAINAGAFGGSRHGLVEAQTNSEAQRNIGDLSGNLLNQAYGQAAQLSAQDISNLMQTGQFNSGMTQQGNLANQSAINARNQYNAGLTQQGAMANQNATNAGNQFNAGLAQQGGLANMAATNAGNQYNAGNQQQAGIANQAAANAAGQYNAGNQQQAGLANMGAANAAGQFNAGQTQNWAGMQSNDQIARAQGMLGAGGNLQGLGGMLFGVGNNVGAQQQQAGGLAQQLIQQIMSGAQGQYGQAMSQPQNLLNMQLQALGMNPLQNATTTSQQYNPGFLDYAALAAQLAGSWMGKPA